jgi:hypothetical protein
MNAYGNGMTWPLMAAFDRMRAAGVTLNLTTYTSLINAYTKDPVGARRDAYRCGVMTAPSMSNRSCVVARPGCVRAALHMMSIRGGGIEKHGEGALRAPALACWTSPATLGYPCRTRRPVRATLTRSGGCQERDAGLPKRSIDGGAEREEPRRHSLGHGPMCKSSMH